MSNRNGKLVKCDRCGTEIFLECTGEGERDGGFTRWNTFESKPNGWSTGSYRDTFNDLCPDCSTEWNKIKADFMDKQK